jgi:hypothetical protein
MRIEEGDKMPAVELIDQKRARIEPNRVLLHPDLREPRGHNEVLLEHRIQDIERRHANRAQLGGVEVDHHLTRRAAVWGRQGRARHLGEPPAGPVLGVIEDLGEGQL